MSDKDFDAEPNKKPGQVDNKAVSHFAFKASLGSIISLTAGFGANVVIAWLFGAGAEMDAFLTALVVPGYLGGVLLSGLSFVFIPAFVEDHASGREDDAWALVGTFFWLITVILIALAVFGALFANQILAISAPGLSPEKAQLSAAMLVILMFSVLPSGLDSLTSGIQNARGDFFWPAASGAVNSLANMLVLLLLYQRMGAMALAWGYLIAVTLKAAVTIIPVLRHGWKRLVPLRDPRVREMFRLIAPFILFGILTRSTGVLQRYFASDLADGELSYLGYADKIAAIFLALLGRNIATAIFPIMSKGYARDGISNLKPTFKYGLRLTLAVGLPAVAIISAVAVPMIMMLYERGAFDHETTLRVARIVPVVLIGAVLFQMIGNLMSRTLYVTKDTRTVPIIAAVSAVMYIFLANALVKSYGYVGLAWAQTIYGGIGLLIMTVVLIRRLDVVRLTKSSNYFVAYGLASAAAFFVASILLRLLAPAPAVVQLIVAGGAGGLFYLGVMYRLDPLITGDILDMVGVSRVFRRISARRVVPTTEANSH